MTERLNYLAGARTFGDLPSVLEWDELEWLRDLPGKNFFGLWLFRKDPDLPPGYDNYIISYHNEPLDWEWLRQQATLVSGNIIILNDGWPYDNFDLLPNVKFYTYHSWHFQINRIYKLWPNIAQKNPKYKVSAINNRVTQSKLIIFTAILELIEDKSLVKLSSWIESKNVNWYAKTGYPILDELTETFKQKYAGKTIEIDHFKDFADQEKNSNPNGRAYTEAALHFCLESYNHSYIEDTYGAYTRSGPHLSEKTFKCLLGETAFIPVSQYDVYNQLQHLGFMFDYGPLDLSFDRDPRNLSRLEKLVELCKTINIYSIEELVHFTKESNEYNREHIVSGDFAQTCIKQNEQTANTIIRDMS